LQLSFPSILILHASNPVKPEHPYRKNQRHHPSLPQDPVNDIERLVPEYARQVDGAENPDNIPCIYQRKSEKHTDNPLLQNHSPDSKNKTAYRKKRLPADTILDYLYSPLHIPERDKQKDVIIGMMYLKYRQQCRHRRRSENLQEMRIKIKPQQYVERHSKSQESQKKD